MNVLFAIIGAVLSTAIPGIAVYLASKRVKKTSDVAEKLSKLQRELDLFVLTQQKSNGRSKNHLPLEPQFPTVQDAVYELKLRSTLEAETRNFEPATPHL
jgi:hypothetical protein